MEQPVLFGKTNHHFSEISDGVRADPNNNQASEYTSPDEQLVHLRRTSFRTVDDEDLVVQHIEVHETIFLDDQDYNDEPDDDEGTSSLQEDYRSQNYPHVWSHPVAIASTRNGNPRSQTQRTEPVQGRYHHHEL